MWGRKICSKWILLNPKNGLILKQNADNYRILLQRGPNHILDLYYVDIQSIHQMSHIRRRPPLPMVGICQNSAEIAARPKQLVSNFTSSQKQVEKKHVPEDHPNCISL